MFYSVSPNQQQQHDQGKWLHMQIVKPTSHPVNQKLWECANHLHITTRDFDVHQSSRTTSLGFPQICSEEEL